MAERLPEGVILKVNKTAITSTGTLTPITLVTSIGGPGEKTDSIETTPLTLGYKTKRPGLYDAGQLTLEVMYDPSNADHLWFRGRPAAKTMNYYEIDIPADPAGGATTTISFVGFVTDFNPNYAGPGELLTASATIEVTGQITYA
jgi:hypothetical protein